MPLITPEQFSDYYPKIQDPNRIGAIEVVIGWVDRLLAAYCCFPLTTTGLRTLQSAAYVLYPDPLQADARALPLWFGPTPLTIDTVHVDDDWVYGSDTLVDAADYLYGDDGHVWATPTGSAVWSTSARSNRVAVTAGYDLSTSDGAQHSLVALVSATVQAVLDRPSVQGALVATIGSQSRTAADLDRLIPAAVRAALDSECVLWGRRVG